MAAKYWRFFSSTRRQSDHPIRQPNNPRNNVMAHHGHISSSKQREEQVPETL